MRDGRAGSSLTRAQGTLRGSVEFSGAQWNPRLEHIFATSDERGICALRDDRMAFGPAISRTQAGIVHTVSTYEHYKYFRQAVTSCSTLQSCTKSRCHVSAIPPSAALPSITTVSQT